MSENKDTTNKDTKPTLFWYKTYLKGTTLETLKMKNMCEVDKTLVSLEINEFSCLSSGDSCNTIIAERSCMFTSFFGNILVIIKISLRDRQMVVTVTREQDTEYTGECYEFTLYGKDLRPLTMPHVMDSTREVSSCIEFNTIKSSADQKTKTCTIYCAIRLYRINGKATKFSSSNGQIWSHYDKDETKDVKLYICDRQKEFVHANKFVLGIASPVFYAKFYGEFQTKNEVIIRSDSFEAIKIMVKFCYQAPEYIWKQDIKTLETAYSLLQLASEYQLPSLFAKLCASLVSFAVPKASEMRLIKEVMTFAKLFILQTKGTGTGPASFDPKKLAVGDIVAAPWTEDSFYPATILEIKTTGVIVQFLADDVQRILDITLLKKGPEPLNLSEFTKAHSELEFNEFLSDNSKILYANCTEFLCKHIDVVSSMI
jgi:hypothetical protein